ncbi:hypothetical protein CYLTODRAFT_413678 [Cylindrobasidium torrendii FP15055 ss-10]|uniref:Uncharacterized protein n=1 Tax=Cylindrobasidium torrendii FP15055 ss-10 TaxID=1314674 RepID=A0A0D7B0D9_9AGAR|nr:hypothetical protein CYLTODRAFT_413678 [Cylindrobasidium torrendii FP15055 ss-10]
MPLFLLSSIHSCGEDFWSTCIWNVPESFSKGIINHITLIKGIGGNPLTAELMVVHLTAELQNIADALRWVSGIKNESLREKAIIVVASTILPRSLLEDSDIKYSPAQAAVVSEINYLRKACPCLAIKHIDDVEAEHRVKEGSTDTKVFDGGIDGIDGKLDVDLSEKLVKSVVGASNVWATADDGFGIIKRRTACGKVFLQTKSLLVELEKKHTSDAATGSPAGFAEQSLKGVSQMQESVEEFLKELRRKHFTTASKQKSRPIPSTLSAPSMTPKTLLEPCPVGTGGLNRQGSSFLENLMLFQSTHLNMKAPNVAVPAAQSSSKSALKRHDTMDGEVKKEPALSSNSAEVDANSKAAAFDCDRFKSTKESKQQNRDQATAASGSANAKDKGKGAGANETRQPSVSGENGKKQVREKPKKYPLAGPLPIYGKRKVGSDATEEVPSSKRKRVGKPDEKSGKGF